MQIKIGVLANRDKFFRRGPDYENISLLQNLVSEGAANSLTFANYGCHPEVIILVALNLTDCLADKWRVRRYDNLSQVILQPKVPGWIVTSLVRWQEKSSNPQNEQGARDGQAQSDRSN